MEMDFFARMKVPIELIIDQLLTHSIDGSKIDVSIPIVGKKTSNSISISWNSSSDATSYHVGIVDSFGNLVSFTLSFFSFSFSFLFYFFLFSLNR